MATTLSGGLHTLDLHTVYTSPGHTVIAQALCMNHWDSTFQLQLPPGHSSRQSLARSTRLLPVLLASSLPHFYRSLTLPLLSSSLLSCLLLTPPLPSHRSINLEFGREG